MSALDYTCGDAAKRAVPGAPAYSVSKAAVDSLTQNSALELAPRVRSSIQMQNLACTIDLFGCHCAAACVQ